MKVLFVVCARKGSKRLKNKHWREVSPYQSMWHRAWEQVETFWFGCKKHHVVFSTDDRKVLVNLLEAYKIRRPPHLASDETPIHEVLQHAYRESKFEADAVAFIPANVPTITSKLIARCVRHLERNQKFDSVITVRTMRDHPEWAWRSPESFNGLLIPAFDRPTEYRMQGLPTHYVATGTVNIVRTPVLMACKSAAAFDYLGRNIGFVMDEDAIEVHDKRDLELARAWLAYREGSK